MFIIREYRIEFAKVLFSRSSIKSNFSCDDQSVESCSRNQLKFEKKSMYECVNGLNIGNENADCNEHVKIAGN